MKCHTFQWAPIVAIVVIILFAIAKQVETFDQDEIKNLPGSEFEVPFRQFSGYLDGGKGRQLFYWFVLKEQNSDTAPVMLWLNGGPGCSSLGGLFIENGPFRVKNDNKSLELDPFSWNQLGNVLYIESPFNVGFSYNQSSLDHADMYNDEATTEALYNGLIHFFKKFPQFNSSNFYLTGESYAGFYIPLLTRKILRNNSTHQFNLKGIAIGNAFFDEELMASSRIFYAYYHGLMSFQEWKQLKQTCCTTKNIDNELDIFQCDFPFFFPNETTFTRNNNPSCANMTESYIRALSEDIDWYDIYDDCDKYPNQPTHFCINQYYGLYLNRSDVQKALRVNQMFSQKGWIHCNKDIQLNYVSQYFSMDKVLKEIVEDHQFNNVVLYNGDIDMACDFVSENYFLFEKLKFKTSKKSHPWKYDNRWAGIATRFTNGVRFFTIHGGGHKVPQQKPRQSLAVIKDLLHMKSIQ